MHVATLDMPALKGTKTQKERQEKIWKLCEAWASQQEGKRRWFKGQIKQTSDKIKSEVWQGLKDKYGYAKPWDEEPTLKPKETWNGSLDEFLENEPKQNNNRIARHFENLESNGHSVEAESKSTKKKKRKKFVQWDEDEIGFLAIEILQMRREDPGAQIVHLLNKAQAELTPDRRRNITTVGQFEPILKKMKELEDDVWNDHKSIVQYRQKIEEQKEAPSRQEVFESVTEDELEQHFFDRVMDSITPDRIIKSISPQAILEMIPLPQIAAYVTLTQMKNLETLSELESLLWEVVAQVSDEPKPVPNQSPVHPGKDTSETKRKPKVVFYGLLPRQHRIIDTRIGKEVKCQFVDKKREKDVVPESAEIVVFWARYCSHSLQDQVKSNLPEGCQFVLHHGGIADMVSKVRIAVSKSLCAN